MLALLLVGAVACGDDDHKKTPDSGFDEDGSVDETVRDGGRDGSTPPRPDASNPGNDGGGGNTDLDAGGGGDGGGGGGGGDGGDAATSGNDGGGNTTPDGGPNNPDGGNDAVISATAISFGLQPCGGSAPAAQTLTVRNPGTAPLTFTATLSATTAFTLADAVNGALSGSIAVGASRSFTISAAAVDAAASAGQTITASLDVVTNAPAPNDHVTIPVTVVPQGATLVVVPSTVPSASFGIVPINQTASTLPVKLQNTGNVAAQVAVSQPSVAQFSLLNGTTLASAVTVPAAAGGTPGSVDLTARFLPTFVGPLASSAGLGVSGPVCNGGTSAKLVSLEGTGSGTGFVATLTTPLSATVNCGASGGALPTGTVTVGNFTPGALTFTASLLGDTDSTMSPFTLGATSAPVASQGTATVAVSLKQASAPQTAVPGTVLSDTIVLTPPTGLGLSPIQLPITTTVQGAVLSFGSAAPFNGATNAVPQAQQLIVKSVGNLPVSPSLSVSGGDANLFTVTSALAPASIPGGSDASPGQGLFEISFKPPVGDAASKSASVVLTPGPTDVICSVATPAPLALTGTATTPGFQLDTPSNGTLAFGNAGFVACPAGNLVVTPVSLTAAGTAFVKFTNTGSAPLVWTASLAAGQGARFTADTLGNTLQAGASAIIVLTPQPIDYPADTATDAYSDALTIKTDIVNDSDHVISLSQTAQGAVVTTTATATDFGLVHNGLTSPLNPAFSVQNVGNADTNLTITPTITPVVPAGFTPTMGYPQYTFNGVTNAAGTIALAANDTSNVNGLYAPGPAEDDAYASSVADVFSTDASPLCAPLPPTLTFGGTGTAAVVSYSATSVVFPSGGVNATRCGRTATPITIVVSNTGNQDFDITGLDISGPDAALFNAYIGASTVKTATVPKANNGTPGTAAITVAPNQVPANNGGVTYTATLTVPYSIAGEPQPRERDITIVEDTRCPAPPI